MTTKNEHDKKLINNTTMLIFDLIKDLDENTLPDHFLSQHSEVKKKRDDKRFFDNLRHSILLECIRIYEFIIFLMHAQKVKCLYEQEIAEENQAIANESKAPNKKNDDTAMHIGTLSEEQKTKIETLTNKLEFILRKLDSVIIHLDNSIKQQRVKVTTLDEQYLHSKNEFLKHFRQYTERTATDPDFQLILPMQLAHDGDEDPILTNEDIGSLKLTKDTYLEIGQTLANDLKQGTIEINQFISALNNRIEDHLINNIKKYWPTLTNTQHRHLLSVISYAKEKNLFTTAYLKETQSDNEFLNAYLSAIKDRHALVYSASIVELDNQCLDALQSQRDYTQEQKDIFGKLIEEMSFTSNEFDTYLDKMNTHINIMNGRIDNITNINHEDVKTMHEINEEADHLLQDLNLLREHSIKLELKDRNKDDMLTSLNSLQERTDLFITSHFSTFESALNELSNDLLMKYKNSPKPGSAPS